MSEKFDYFIRTISENDIFARQIELGRERIAQVRAAAVRVKVRLIESHAHRFDRLR